MFVYNLITKSGADYTNQWDYGFLSDVLLDNNAEIITVEKLEPTDRAMVLIPARHFAGQEDWLKKELAKIQTLTLVCGGDEEAELDISKLGLPLEALLIQNAHPIKHDKYNKLVTGYPKHFKQYRPKELPEKDLDVFFSGQITHIRRQAMYDVLLPREQNSWLINGTSGFTQGFNHSEYYGYMFRAKVAPCPSGAVVPDSFRAFEALECFAVPLLDDVNPSGSINGGYWDWLLGENPLPKYKEPAEVPTKINEILADWGRISQECIAWYIRYKDDIKGRIYEQYNR